MKLHLYTFVSVCVHVHIFFYWNNRCVIEPMQWSAQWFISVSDDGDKHIGQIPFQ